MRDRKRLNERFHAGLRPRKSGFCACFHAGLCDWFSRWITWENEWMHSKFHTTLYEGFDAKFRAGMRAWMDYTRDLTSDITQVISRGIACDIERGIVHEHEHRTVNCRSENQHEVIWVSFAGLRARMTPVKNYTRDRVRDSAKDCARERMRDISWGFRPLSRVNECENIVRNLREYTWTITWEVFMLDWLRERAVSLSVEWVISREIAWNYVMHCWNDYTRDLTRDYANDFTRDCMRELHMIVNQGLNRGLWGENKRAITWMISRGITCMNESRERLYMRMRKWLYERLRARTNAWYPAGFSERFYMGLSMRISRVICMNIYAWAFTRDWVIFTLDCLRKCVVSRDIE